MGERIHFEKYFIAINVAINKISPGNCCIYLLQYAAADVFINVVLQQQQSRNRIINKNMISNVCFFLLANIEHSITNYRSRLIYGMYFFYSIYLLLNLSVISKVSFVHLFYCWALICFSYYVNFCFRLVSPPLIFSCHTYFISFSFLIHFLWPLRQKRVEIKINGLSR